MAGEQDLGGHGDNTRFEKKDESGEKFGDLVSQGDSQQRIQDMKDAGHTFEGMSKLNQQELSTVGRSVDAGTGAPDDESVTIIVPENSGVVASGKTGLREKDLVHSVGSEGSTLLASNITLNAPSALDMELTSDTAANRSQSHSVIADLPKGEHRQLGAREVSDASRVREVDKHSGLPAAELQKAVDSIRESGMLTAPERTGKGNVEYRMVMFKDGSHTSAHKSKFVFTNPVTKSDVYAQALEITTAIALNSAMGNRPVKLVHSHPNKDGMDPYLYSKEDIGESNASGADSIIIGPDGRMFLHRANPDPRYMDPANVPDEMRKPDCVLGKFDSEGRFHKAKYDGDEVTFEAKGI